MVAPREHTFGGSKPSDSEAVGGSPGNAGFSLSGVFTGGSAASAAAGGVGLGANVATTLLSNPFVGTPSARYSAPVPSTAANSSPVKPGGADAVGQSAKPSPLMQDAGGPNSGAQGAGNSGDAAPPNGENPISRFLNGEYRADPDLEILYLNGEFQLVERLETGRGAAALRLGKAAGRLPRFLRNKLKHIRNALARGGNTGIPGIVTPAEALRLGEAFVGKGFHVMSNGKGLISKDGLRQFRLPSAKRGIDPMTGNPFSRTGFQANFQARSIPEGYWTSNVHLDVGL